jgi:hypothetical protein
MNKLGAFIRLDYGTVKPYLTLKNLIIFAGVTLFLSVTNGSVGIGVGVGCMLGTLLTGYPFAIGEKSNLDALYTTLAVNRKTVVLGRYLFVLLLNVGCILFSFVFATFGVFGARALNIFQNDGGDSFWAVAILSGTLLLVQMGQLPIYFKLGYTKAKFMSIFPFALFMAAFAAFATLAKNSSFVAEFSNNLGNLFRNKALFAAIIVAALALIILCSYRLSESAYKKREF